MDFLHLLAASIWIGSLIGFVGLLSFRKKPELKQEYLKMVKSFSKWGILLVLFLTVNRIVWQLFIYSKLFSTFPNELWTGFIVQSNPIFANADTCSCEFY